MFLRATTRKKDGKEHRYWSIVENRRLSVDGCCNAMCCIWGRSTPRRNGRGVNRLRYSKTAQRRRGTLALFPEDRCEGVVPDAAVVRLRLVSCGCAGPGNGVRVGWRFRLWQELRLDQFWAKRLLPSRKGTRWDQVLFVLVAYRLLAPGSEWRLHREWYERSALADLLGADAALCDIHTLYRCHDRLLEHKRAVFDH